MATATTPGRPPLPPFPRESAIQKVRLAEDGWNTRDPAKVALAYAVDSRCSPETASPYASRTSGTTTRVTGVPPMAMRTGSSMTTGSWRQGMHRSTTSPFRKPIANTTGYSGDVPKAIQD
jgi:hypothetical protein